VIALGGVGGLGFILPAKIESNVVFPARIFENEGKKKKRIN